MNPVASSVDLSWAGGVGDLSVWQIVLRITLALMAGALVGLERESHGRVAGLRTTMLVCLASAVAMIISERFFYESSTYIGHLAPRGAWGPDPARLAAGVLTGMGFLGGGAIVREGNVVRGVTTAATLWFMTVLGLAFGAGHLILGLGGLILAMIILTVLPWLEKKVRNDYYGAITMVLGLDGLSEDDIRSCIESTGITVKKMDLDYDVSAKRRTVRLELKYKSGDVFGLSRRLIADLASRPGVIQARWS